MCVLHCVCADADEEEGTLPDDDIIRADALEILKAADIHTVSLKAVKQQLSDKYGVSTL